MDILLIQDNRDLAVVYKQFFLYTYHTQCRHVLSIEDAVIQIALKKPDIIVIDNTMADGNSKDLIDALRFDIDSVLRSIIVLCGKNEDIKLISRIKRLNRPFTMEDLKTKVNSILNI